MRENYCVIVTPSSGTGFAAVRFNYSRGAPNWLKRRPHLPQIRFHDLRHRHATLLLLQGENPKAVGERLEHASVRMTLDTYSHVLPGMQEAVASRLDVTLRRGLRSRDSGASQDQP